MTVDRQMKNDKHRWKARKRLKKIAKTHHENCPLTIDCTSKGQWQAGSVEVGVEIVWTSSNTLQRLTGARVPLMHSKEFNALGRRWQELRKKASNVFFRNGPRSHSLVGTGSSLVVAVKERHRFNWENNNESDRERKREADRRTQ